MGYRIVQPKQTAYGSNENRRYPQCSLHGQRHGLTHGNFSYLEALVLSIAINDPSWGAFH
jgi:hypothetical protein